MPKLKDRKRLEFQCNLCDCRSETKEGWSSKTVCDKCGPVAQAIFNAGQRSTLTRAMLSCPIRQARIKKYQEMLEKSIRLFEDTPPGWTYKPYQRTNEPDEE